MRIIKYILLACAALMGGFVNAQSQDELGQLMRERNEYYFTLNVDNSAEILTLSNLCSVDDTDGRSVVCYANQQQYERLLILGYQPILETPPCMQEETVMWDGTDRTSYEWDSYPTYSAYQSMMEAFPTQAQATGNRSCTLLDLGTLNSGRKILGVRLNNGQPDGKPKFLYSSTMHGDEVTGMMLMLRLIDEFCTSNDSRILNILNNVDLFIFPNTNPDGTYYGGNNSMNQARRYNINGVDLNRNYKDYFNGDHPDGNSWALETQWTMQLAQDYLFTMAANYHGGAEVMNYPWDAVYDNHPDKAWWQLVSAEYVSNARTYSSSYMTDTYSSGVTNGAAWYVITGSRQDYENAYGECREITVECSSTKKPSASTMPTYWNYNHTAMLAFIEQCTKGVHGFVYDAVTDEPLQGVSVSVENHDNNLSKVTSHNVGDFHRPIKGGTYTFTFTKDGYYPESIQVTVADGQRVELNNILLNPVTWTISATANPINGGTVMGDGNFATGATCTVTATAADNYQFVKWTENGATVSTDAVYSFTVSSDRVLVAVFGSTIPVSINVSASPARAGTVSGGGEFLIGETCAVTATANTGWAFTNWTENGIVVSTEPTYSFEVEEERTLVANFSYEATASGNCYYNVSGVSAEAYVLGYRDGATLHALTRNNNAVAASTVTVTPTDYGFSVEEGTSLPQITLQDYGNSGQQFYIKYNYNNNTYYLAKSSNGTSLTWTTSSNSSSARWYINADGVYVTSYNGTSYYLYYDANSSSFKLSNTQQNNISLYTEGDCPLLPQYAITATSNPAVGGTIDGADTYYQGETCTLTATANDGYGFFNWTESGEEVSTEATYSFEVNAARDLVANFLPIATQTVTLEKGWNWWAPTVDVELAVLTDSLSTNGLTIESQDNGSLTYENEWSGNLTSLFAGEMYKIQVSEACSFTLSGMTLDNIGITIDDDITWFGYTGTEASVSSVFGNTFQPAEGDKIIDQNEGFAIFEDGEWKGTLTTLHPGRGYIFISNNPEPRNRQFTPGK